MKKKMNSLDEFMVAKIQNLVIMSMAQKALINGVKMSGNPNGLTRIVELIYEIR